MFVCVCACVCERERERERRERERVCVAWKMWVAKAAGQYPARRGLLGEIIFGLFFSGKSSICAPKDIIPVVGLETCGQFQQRFKRSIEAYKGRFSTSRFKQRYLNFLGRPPSLLFGNYCISLLTYSLFT